MSPASGSVAVTVVTAVVVLGHIDGALSPPPFEVITGGSFGPRAAVRELQVLYVGEGIGAIGRGFAQIRDRIAAVAMVTS